MSRYLLPIFILMLFIVEGTIFQVFAQRYGADFILVPRFLVISIVMIGIFMGSSYGLIYGIMFGFLYDVVYTELLGVYMFSMGLIGYVLSLSYTLVQRSFFLTSSILLVAVLLNEYFLFGLYSIIGIVDMTQDHFVYDRLLPGLLLNALFVVVIYYPLKKYLTYLQRLKSQTEK